MSWCAFRAATMPATRWSSTASPINFRCCRPAWCARASSRSSAMAWCVDPWALAEEIDKIGKLGVSVSRDNLARRRERDSDSAAAPRARCIAGSQAGDGKIGTTKRGIGPAYEDKVGRRAIRVIDLQDLPSLKPKIERLLAHHNALRRGLGQPEIGADELCAQLTEIAPKMLPFVDTVWALLDAKRRAGQAHPVRGRARRAARYRSRHLSVRHLVQHGGGAGRVGLRARAWRHRLCARHHQGLHDARRRGALSRPN